jgi:DNA-binding NarL/FixJ family response regulator
VVTVLTVDDHASFRGAAHALVGATDGFEEVGQASSALEAIEAADRLRPDLVLMDLRLPDMDGCEASRRIVAKHPDTVVVLITSTEALVRVSDAAACSAAALMGKDRLRPAVLREIWEDHLRDG